MTALLGGASTGVGEQHVVSMPGQKVELAVDAPGETVQAAIVWADGRKETRALPVSSGGKTATFAVEAAAPTGTALLRLGPGEDAPEASIDLVSGEAFAELDALAAAVPLKEPLRILYLGDSLTAQRAGRNHADKIDFWLNRHHPGKATLRNAAVGGDTTRTVWRRFNHLLDPEKKAQFRQETYDGIFDFRPNVVILFLGHNDTKASNTSEFREPHIAPAVQEQSLRSILALLKERTQARIILLSTISPVEEKGRERAQQRAAEGRTHYLMHGRPELLEAYNTLLQKLAKEEALEYVDLYTPFRDHPQKPSLFSDHVHLTEEGNRFVALLVLRHLAAGGER